MSDVKTTPSLQSEESNLEDFGNNEWKLRLQVNDVINFLNENNENCVAKVTDQAG